MNFAAQLFYSTGLKKGLSREDGDEEKEYDPFWQRSAESKHKKIAASTSSELYLHKDRPRINSCAEQKLSSIHPERLKDFGEEEELNGGVKTWEMKIVSHEEEKLNDSTTCPEVAISKPVYTTCKKIQDISAAAIKIQYGVLKTPCTYSRLSKQYGMEIYLKKEILQYTGTAKERGVLYLLMSLQEEQKRNGVIVASDCNFSMAVTYHASELYIPVFVIMCACTPPSRAKICREYGAMVIFYGSTVKDSQLHARRLAQENNYLYLEEDDSALYLSGLGTMGLEIYEQVPKLDAVILATGISSGLLASTSAALKHLNQHVFVVAFELLGWQKLGQGTGAHPIVRRQGFELPNCQPSDRQAQRLYLLSHLDLNRITENKPLFLFFASL